eukprot:CAMPEP_0118914886 /NCGR_PEP_ID=MMETSP1166-20130328/15189_1 /TAXON_ID=1104430 /ORGANISM="Chrysoreinhardia sp, Strain CCMP3193" /LENGTH=110 /DNA_ID=CAMNT_0006854519 /DNA_START=85 /DNA_END=413 /DNA_ORIENTATION=+
MLERVQCDGGVEGSRGADVGGRGDGRRRAWVFRESWSPEGAAWGKGREGKGEASRCVGVQVGVCQGAGASGVDVVGCVVLDAPEVRADVVVVGKVVGVWRFAVEEVAEDG